MSSSGANRHIVPMTLPPRSLCRLISATRSEWKMRARPSNHAIDPGLLGASLILAR